MPEHSPDVPTLAGYACAASFVYPGRVLIQVSNFVTRTCNLYVIPMSTAIFKPTVF